MNEHIFLDSGRMIVRDPDYWSRHFTDIFFFEPHYIYVYKEFMELYNLKVVPEKLYRAAIELEAWYEDQDFIFSGQILSGFLSNAYSTSIEKAMMHSKSIPMLIKKLN